MPITNFYVDSNEPANLPRVIKMSTTDTRAQVASLNYMKGFEGTGYYLNQKDVVIVYFENPETGIPVTHNYLIYEVSKGANGTITLIPNVDPYFVDKALTSSMYLPDIPNINMLRVESSVSHSDLASGGVYNTPITSGSGKQYLIHDIYSNFNGASINFAGGDRNIELYSGSSGVVFCTFTAVFLASMSNATWGDAGIDYPASPISFDTPSPAGDPVQMRYSGGASDYSSGILNVSIIFTRIV